MVQERIEEMLRERLGGVQRPAQAAQPAQPRRGRGPGIDNGTLALGVTAMSFYWLMPALMSRRKRKRRKPPTEPQQPPAQV